MTKKFKDLTIEDIINIHKSYKWCERNKKRCPLYDCCCFGDYIDFWNDVLNMEVTLSDTGGSAET